VRVGDRKRDEALLHPGGDFSGLSFARKYGPQLTVTSAEKKKKERHKKKKDENKK